MSNPYGLQLLTWDGHDIQGAEYTSDFTEDGQTQNTLKGTPVEVVRAGNTPLHARMDLDGVSFNIEITLEDEYTQARLDTLKQWFSPLLEGERYVIATDEAGSGSQRRAGCVVEQLEIYQSPNVFKAMMRNASGLWEAASTSTHSQSVDATSPSTLTWSLTNPGSVQAPIQIDVTAAAAKDGTLSWDQRIRIAFANRSEDPLGDWIGDGYMVKLGNLTDLGVSQIGGTWDHVRVLIYGRWVDRYIDADDNLWVNYRWRPRKVATLAADITDSDTALAVSNADGFGRDVWPDRKFFLYLDDEAFFCADQRDATTLTGLNRGVLGSTAASHSAGATLYWIEHPYINIVIGFTAATDPQPPDDRKPMIDLTASENDSHVYGADGLLAPGTRRSGQFQHRSSDEGVGAQHVRLYASGANGVFENNQATADKPAFNDLVLDLPVPASGTILADLDVDISMRVRGFIADDQRYESRLIDQGFSDGLLAAQPFSLPGIARRLRLTGSIGVVVGNLVNNDSLLFDAPATPGTAIPGPDPAEDDSIEILQQYQNTAVRFDIRQDADGIKGLVVAVAKAGGASGDLSLYIMEDGGGRPAVDVVGTTVKAFFPHILGGVTIPNADIPTGTPAAFELDLTDLSLASGTYWLSYFRAAGETGHFYTGAGSGIGANVFTSYVNGGLLGAEGITFGILSDEAEPQGDAPLDNGDTAEVANLVIPLDSSRTPKIGLSAIQDFYLNQATVSTGYAGDFLTLLFPQTLAAALHIDTGLRQLIDEEFGVSVPWARRDSSERWPHLGPQGDEATWSEDGALATVATVVRGPYL